MKENTRNENYDTEPPIKKFQELAEQSLRVPNRRFGVLPRQNGGDCLGRDTIQNSTEEKEAKSSH